MLSLESSFGEFAVNPIGAFFDPDSTYDAQKASAKESLRLSVENTASFKSSVPKCLGIRD